MTEWMEPFFFSQTLKLQNFLKIESLSILLWPRTKYILSYSVFHVMSFKESDLAVYKFCVINQFYIPLFESCLRAHIFAIWTNSSVFTVMFITQCSASDIELWLAVYFASVCYLLCHFLIYGPAHWTGDPPRGIPQNHEPAVEYASAPPELCKWMFPTINYPQNNSAGSQHEDLSALKRSKSGGKVAL